MFVRLLGVGVVALILWAVAARSSSGAGHRHVYVVKPADTLWSIAAAHYRGDAREGIWKLERRNRLPTSTIHPGQRLVLP